MISIKTYSKKSNAATTRIVTMIAPVTSTIAYKEGLDYPYNHYICGSEEEFCGYIEKYGKKIFQMPFLSGYAEPIAPPYDPIYYCVRYSYPKGLAKLIELGANIKEHPVAYAHGPLVDLACTHDIHYARPMPKGNALETLQKSKVEVLRILLEQQVPVNSLAPLIYLCGNARLTDPALSHFWEMVYLILRAGVCEPYYTEQKWGSIFNDLLQCFMNFEVMKSCPLTRNQLKELIEIFRAAYLKSVQKKEMLPLVKRMLLTMDGQIQRLNSPYADRVHTLSRRSEFWPHDENIVESANRLKSSGYEAVGSEKEILTAEQQIIKERIVRYLKEEDKSLLTHDEKCIFNSFRGGFEELSPTNMGPRLLELVKIIDFAIDEQLGHKPAWILCTYNTYGIRSTILKFCPFMTTAEAFTKTLDPVKMKDRNYLSNPLNWHASRAFLHLNILTNQQEKMKQAHAQISQKPHVWAVRGNTGSGKTHLLTHDPIFKNHPEIYLSPDDIKFLLKCDPPFTNSQVHDEGVALFNRFKNSQMAGNLLLEGRFSSFEDLETGVLDLARKRNSAVSIVDIEVPLTTSLNRVLARDPFGEDPCPPLRDIVKGYKDGILYRRKMIENIRNDPTVQSYKLYQKDIWGVSHLVAEKQDGKFIVHLPGRLEACCALPSDDRIESLLAEPINADYVNHAVARGDIPEASKEMLETWMGIPIGDAVKMHITGQPVPDVLRKYSEESHYREVYGAFLLEPFSGDWLSDFSLLPDFVRIEQQLHARDLDEEGRGKHFATGTFSSKLNPKFNPEKGNQMKLGYFIIPLEMMETFRVPSLSSHVLQSLEERSASGELIGYRFFIHPEAYDHFKCLHDANIPFVKPSESQFIGAPTSTYRSWIVRRQCSKPFIVKFGVASAPNDVRRLLPKDEIKKSIQTQIHLTKIGTGELQIFQETFGLTLKGIPGYPPEEASLNGKNVDSGNLIRELPEDLLQGTCQYVSMSALMSVERKLPLIYEVMDATIRKGLVKTPAEFIQKYLIEDYLKAIEQIAFKEGLAFAPHGQNLCMRLSPDLIPCGYAYRDLEGFSDDKQKGFLETFSWFYRYHIFVKMLNVITKTAQECLPPPPGAPTQVGFSEKPPERNLNGHVIRQIAKDEKIYTKAMEILNRLSLTPDESSDLLKKLDRGYIASLSRFFDVHRAGIISSDGTIPAAEKSSAGECELMKLNARLWKHRQEAVKT